MKKSKNKKVSRVKKLVNPSLILKVKIRTESPVKPLNGSLPRSNSSHMLRLYPVRYRYKNGKEYKEKEVQSYYIKGLRGCLRHAVMKVCKDHELEVCHSTDRAESTSGNSLLPSGFHLLGSCAKNGGECIVHSIFGSKSNESKISVFSHPIATINHKTSETNGKIQNVHISTENRLCKTFDGKSVQDFGERYFSGEFEFEINVTKTSNEERGLLIESIISMEKLGRGFNAGYGHLKVVNFQLLKKNVIRTVEWEENKFIVKEKINEESLRDEVTEAMQEWERWINEIGT
ncbi:MAG: RAMP superfamily CRISPR-associated protein [Candidatus Hodarchaeales archaeon]